MNAPGARAFVRDDARLLGRRTFRRPRWWWASALALLAATSCSETDHGAAKAPANSRGDDVLSMETDISGGERATFYFTDAGFMPASNERVEVVSAGPRYGWSDERDALTYRWAFELKFAEGAKPASIEIENVTDREAAETLIPKRAIQRTAKVVRKGDAFYGVPNAEWKTVSDAECRVARDEPCSAWLYDTESSPLLWNPGAVFVALRIRIGYANGDTDTLYQGLSFHPEKELKRIQAQLTGGQD